MANARIPCVICNKERSTFKCGGCLQEFCFNHLTEHKQKLSKEFDEVELNRDLLKQTFSEYTSEPFKHHLIEEINRWENESIKRIQQAAEETRQIILKQYVEHMKQLETKLNKLTEQLRQRRDENDFFETDLCQWNEQLRQLAHEFNAPSNITLREDHVPFITKIAVDITPSKYCDDSLLIKNRSNREYTFFSQASITNPCISINTKWISNGVTVAGGNGKGNGLNQLSNPWGLWVHDDQTIYVADCQNFRIVEWKSGVTTGRVVAAGNGSGNRVDQLNSTTDVILDSKNDCLLISDYGNKRVVRWPRQNGTTGEVVISNVVCWSLALDNNGDLYVSDYVKNEVRKWAKDSTNGILVAGGNGTGNRLNQLNGRLYIYVDKDRSVYVSDEGNHRVMKWTEGAQEGIVVAGGNGQGNSLSQLYNPLGIVVDQWETIYVADSMNNRVMQWSKGATEGNIVAGGNGQGGQANQLYRPYGLRLDQYGNLYVVDNCNSRVQQFNIDPNSHK